MNVMDVTNPQTYPLSATVRVNASAEAVFAAATDWERQGEWMTATSVRPTALNGQAVGGGIAAFTGIGPIGFVDTMVITAWDPPRRCSVRHTGRVVRGTGDFIVEPVTAGTSDFIWAEQVIVPFGRLGAATWPLARPAAQAILTLSLRRFAHWAERRATETRGQ